MIRLRKPWRPPGLMELAEAESLTEQQIEQLVDAYSTMRGGRPSTLKEWQVIYAAVKPYLTGNEKES